MIEADETLIALGVEKGIHVVGTSGSDRVRIQSIEESNVSLIDFVINGISQGKLNFTSNEETDIYVDLADGNDRLEIGPGLSNRIVAEGGAGNDTLGGGDGSDFLRGGAGTDRYLRSGGKDRLIA